jgi:CRISPR-associated protein Csy2
MSDYILIKNIEVQNANAVAGLTSGFPAITHFLGFMHNLHRKYAQVNQAKNIQFHGVAVVSHKLQMHTFGKYDERFVQSKNPPYLQSHNKKESTPIIEEGKMNMTVSLVISMEGYIGENDWLQFKQWLINACYLQRLAGGTILTIEEIERFKIDKTDSNMLDFRRLKRSLMPGFVLIDRCEYLEEHYKNLKEVNEQSELLDAWLDFSSLKYIARPQSDLIEKYLTQPSLSHLYEVWQTHKALKYASQSIPEILKSHFNALPEDKKFNKLLEQWSRYSAPDEKTDADWEYVPKPYRGWLVPIMNGYKAISPVYKAGEVSSTRDDETEVCFVEATHSIAEWLGINRIRTVDDLTNCFWQYCYEKNWYLCKKISLTKQSVLTSHSVGTTEDYL